MVGANRRRPRGRRVHRQHTWQGNGPEMKAREEILRRIQSAQVAPNDHAVRRDYAHAVKLADPVGMFVERVEDYKATVIRTSPEGVAAAVLESLDGAARVVVPAGFNASWLPDGIDIDMD